MIRLYCEAAFMVLFALYLVVSCIHSFNVPEEVRAADMSINRYIED